jgi:hypothetical protein
MQTLRAAFEDVSLNHLAGSEEVGNFWQPLLSERCRDQRRRHLTDRELASGFASVPWW